MVPPKNTSKSGAPHKPTTTAKEAPKQAIPAIKPESPTPAPKPDFKATAPAEKPEPITSAEPKPSIVLAPEVASKAEPTVSRQQKEDEKLGVKLRRKGDILNALRAGGALLLTTEGLYRIVNRDGSQNRVSKRRAASFVAQGLVKLTTTNEAGKHYAYDPEAENASAKKTEAKSKPKAESGDAHKAQIPANGN